MIKKELPQLKKRKFDWLPVILLSLIAQYITQRLLLFIESSVDHSMSWVLLIKINFFIVALVGGIVAMHFYIRKSPHIGGICATLFIVLGHLFVGSTAININGLFILLIAYVVGYAGAMLYSNKLAHKRFY